MFFRATSPDITSVLWWPEVGCTYAVSYHYSRRTDIPCRRPIELGVVVTVHKCSIELLRYAATVAPDRGA